MKRILCVVLLAIAVPVLAGDKNKMSMGGGAEQEIKSLITQVREAQVKGDASTVQQLLADDYTFTNPYGEVMTKEQVVSDLKSGNLKFQTNKADDVKVKTYGDTAVATAHVTLAGQRGGQDITGQYRATWVFVKNQGRWQPVAGQSTRIADTSMAGAAQPTTSKPKTEE